jgi:hypothetical protein
MNFLRNTDNYPNARLEDMIADCNDDMATCDEGSQLWRNIRAERTTYARELDRREREAA